MNAKFLSVPFHPIIPCPSASQGPPDENLFCPGRGLHREVSAWIPETQLVAGAGAVVRPCSPAQGGLQNVYHQLNHISVLIECIPGCHNRALCLIEWKVMITCSSHQTYVGTWGSHSPLSLPAPSLPLPLPWKVRSLADPVLHHRLWGRRELCATFAPSLISKCRIGPGQALHWLSSQESPHFPSIFILLAILDPFSSVTHFYIRARITRMLVFCDFVGMTYGKEA